MAARAERYVVRLQKEVRRGYLPLWVMERLDGGPAYGYQLLEQAAKGPVGAFRLVPSTLYPTLARLKAAGLIRSFHGRSSSGPLRKYYELTTEGRKALPVIRVLWTNLLPAAPEGSVSINGAPRPIG